ncbi:hypothetical protein ACH5RR_024322 [Cinchona calisaya]|uniref:Disease resistance protein RGA3 n=1 Tax=Cinchona calisaya TaxID=153742 RepID=A0ABD2YZR9_9GENT
MSDPAISAVLTQLGSILESQIRQEWRLVMGVDKDVENLKKTLVAIDALMVDAEKKRVKEVSVKLWLQNLQEAVYDMDDVLNEWSTALLKIEIEGLENFTNPRKKVFFFLNLPCFCFNRVAMRRDIAIRIKKINGRLDSINTDNVRYSLSSISSNADNMEGPERPKTTSYVDVAKVRGRDGDRTNLVAELLKESGRENRAFDTICILGMGGIGKTTLAQLAYHCGEVEDHFDQMMWVCVSEPFEELRVAKAIVEQLEGQAPNLCELESVLGRLRDYIKGNKFLLVLDDVWTEEYERLEPLINSLNCGAPGSKVLVTTRNEKVAKIMDSSILRLGELTEQDCWSLFSQIAFSERSQKECEELEDIGRRIAKKCRGLPLAAKTMGCLMRFKNSAQDWKNVLESDTWDLEARKGIFPPLLLSYYDLPSPVKLCFSYCANFPQDFEIEADNLIKLWMAQSYLRSTRNVEMEAIGKEYLDILITRSFFQVKKDKGRDGVIRLRMHDMVLELAQNLRSESHVMEIDRGLVLRINSSCGKARHLTLIRSEDFPLPASIGNIEKLHTFWVQSFYDSPPIISEVDKISPDLLNQLVQLKALDLSRNRLGELPKEIQKLMNLRYLNLSHNPFWELPETVCELYNLQTLKLVACDHLRRIPQGIHKLRNLRHLEIDRTASLKTLPKGIGKLPSLQTLTKFVLADSVSTDGEETICRIGDLNSLNTLRGCLKIEGLGHVAHADEAEKAELKNKKYLADLHLDFNPQLQAGARTDVADALEVHTDLQSLHISFYGGDRLPHWMTSLTNLRKLRLQDCPTLSSLPPLGRLPSLENLYMENMHALKHIGAEFFGGSGTNHSTQTNGAVAASSAAAVIIFPKLKKLKFSCISSWEEWEVYSKERGAEAGNLSIMPQLSCLKLSDCSKLKALPDPLLQMSPIRKLYIHNCPLLQQLYHKKTGEHRMKISQISKVRIS